MNQWTVFKDFSETGTPMETFLTPNKMTELGTHRIFYIIRANMDKSVLKIGNSTDGHPSTRLKDYIVKYGEANDNPPCTGANILYCAGTQRNPNVPAKKSQVYEMEEHLKRVLRRKRNGIVPGRGSERTKVTLNVLKGMMLQKGQAQPEVAVAGQTSGRIKVGDIVKYKWDQETVNDHGGDAFLGQTLDAQVDKIKQKSYSIKFLVDNWEMDVSKAKVRK